MSTIKVNRIENTASSSGGINIDSSGRVGVDATPEAWSGFSALEVNEASIVSSGSGDAFFTANAYYDGAWKYKDAGVARNIYMNADGIVFRTAASGSADGAISWTEVGRWREGGGLCFNGDTAAANGLDDYEEGTFTGRFNNADDDATVSHGNQTGYYVKVGSLVHFSLYFDDIDVTSTGSTTAARIYGLPFTSLSSNQHYSVVNIIHNTILTSAAGAYVNTNQTHMIPTDVGSTTSSTFSTGTNKRLMIGGTYRAA